MACSSGMVKWLVEWHGCVAWQVGVGQQDGCLDASRGTDAMWGDGLPSRWIHWVLQSRVLDVQLFQTYLSMCSEMYSLEGLCLVCEFTSAQKALPYIIFHIVCT